MKYKGKSRPDITQGCNEKMDLAFIKWILWEGRTKAKAERYKRIQTRYPDKVVVIRNQKQLDDYFENMKLKNSRNQIGESTMHNAPNL